VTATFGVMPVSSGTPMVTEPPFSTQLSQVLVAFTVEFDNEFEHRMPHRTTMAGRVAARPAGPWLVSQVMWANVMRLVGDEGVPVHELHARARTTRDSLGGLQRWGYVLVSGDRVVHATAAGRRAQEVWRPLAGVIEERWRERFGADAIAALRKALEAVASRSDVELPHYLPIAGHGLFAEAPPGTAPVPDESGAQLDLSALLSQLLLAFALEFEHESQVSLAIAKNTLRVLDTEGVRMRDLPGLTGVSKEAVSMSVGFLEKRGDAVVAPDPAAARGRVVRLTPNGRVSQDSSRRLVATIEARWETRFGARTIRSLRESLARLAGASDAEPSPLFAGMEPYPDGWRTAVRPPTTLPHHPTVLHRGGFPDGS
jgi:DNA-binding MarR family transcriptional regulator